MVSKVCMSAWCAAAIHSKLSVQHLRRDSQQHDCKLKDRFARPHAAEL